MRHDHPLDQELYKTMIQGIVEFQSTVDFTGEWVNEREAAVGPLMC